MSIDPNLVLSNKSYTTAHRNYVRNSYQQKPNGFLKYENPSFIEENKDILWVLAIGTAITGAYFAFRKSLKFPVKATTREINAVPEIIVPFPRHPWLTNVVNDEIRNNPDAYKVVVLKPGTLDNMSEQIKYLFGKDEDGQHIKGIYDTISQKDVNFRYKQIQQFGKADGKEFIIINANEGKNFKLTEPPNKDQLINMFNGFADMEEKGLFGKGLKAQDFGFDNIGAILRNTFKIHTAENSPVHYVPRTSLASAAKSFFWDIKEHFEHLIRFYTQNSAYEKRFASSLERIQKISKDYEENARSALVHHLNSKADFLQGKNHDAARFLKLQAKLLEENNPEYLKIQKIADNATSAIDKAAELWYKKGAKNVTLDNGLKAVESYFNAIKSFADLRESTVKYYGTQSNTLSDYANMQLGAADKWLHELKNWLYTPQNNGAAEGTLPKLHEIIAHKATSNDWDIESLNFKLKYNYIRPDENKEGADAILIKQLNDEAGKIKSAIEGSVADLNYPKKVHKAVNDYMDYVKNIIKMIKTEKI